MEGKNYGTEPRWGQADDTPPTFRRGEGPHSPNAAPVTPGETGGDGGGWTPQIVDSLLGRVESMIKSGYMMYQESKNGNGAHRSGLESEYKPEPKPMKQKMVKEGEGRTVATVAPDAAPPSIPGTPTEVAQRIYNGVLDLFGDIPSPEMVSVQYVIDMLIQEEGKVKAGIEKWLVGE